MTDLFVKGTLPFVWDAPSSEAEVKQITIDLSVGAIRGNWKSLNTKDDCTKPRHTGCIVTANFDLSGPGMMK